MSTATGQRVRPQLSVYNRAMASTPAHHDNDVSARIRTNAFRRTDDCAARVVTPRFQNELHDPWISTNVFPQAPVVVGIIELSAVDRPR